MKKLFSAFILMALGTMLFSSCNQIKEEELKVIADSLEKETRILDARITELEKPDETPGNIIFKSDGTPVIKTAEEQLKDLQTEITAKRNYINELERNQNN